MVEYAETMSPQRYVELITDLCCFFPEEKLVETMRDVLEENGYGHLKDYDFKDIKEVAESSAMFVLVELYPDENGKRYVGTKIGAIGIQIELSPENDLDDEVVEYYIKSREVSDWEVIEKYAEE